MLIVFHFRSGQISRRLRFSGFIDNQLIKTIRLSALRPGLLVIISVTSWVEPRIKSMKNSHDPMENWNRYLPACSAMPQPTAPPRGQVESPATLSRKKEPPVETGKEDGHDVELNTKLSVSPGVEHRLSYTRACSLVTLVNICTLYQQMAIWNKQIIKRLSSKYPTCVRICSLQRLKGLQTWKVASLNAGV